MHSHEEKTGLGRKLVQRKIGTPFVAEDMLAPAEQSRDGGLHLYPGKTGMMLGRQLGDIEVWMY